MDLYLKLEAYTPVDNRDILRMKAVFSSLTLTLPPRLYHNSNSEDRNISVDLEFRMTYSFKMFNRMFDLSEATVTCSQASACKTQFRG
jgi:hypothetical protein